MSASSTRLLIFIILTITFADRKYAKRQKNSPKQAPKTAQAAVIAYYYANAFLCAFEQPGNIFLFSKLMDFAKHFFPKNGIFKRKNASRRNTYFCGIIKLLQCFRLKIRDRRFSRSTFKKRAFYWLFEITSQKQAGKWILAYLFSRAYRHLPRKVRENRGDIL